METMVARQQAKVAFDVRPLTGNIGVELIGLDLHDADQAVMNELARLASEHNVVVLRGQHLGVDQLRRLGPMLGPVMWTPTLTPNMEWPEIWRIDNPGKANAGTETWHTDSTYSEQPPSYSLLSASILPPVGGDTLFVNQYRSYEALSDIYKTMLKGLRVRHATGAAQPGSRAAAAQVSAIHPMVRLHPLTGRPILYVNPIIELTIDGMTAAESRSIFDFLNQHTIHVDRMYRHSWQVGDVLMWDNRCTLHAAVHDYGDAPRTMYRYIAEGEVPIPA